MFQDYTSKVVKTPDYIAVAGSLKTTTSTSTSINSAQRYVSGGAHGVARSIEFDSNNTNVMLSFDGSVSANDGNDFVAFVHTYAADVPLDGDINVPNNETSIVPFFNIQGSGYFQGNVVVPKLELSNNEKQYVMVGVASIKAKASPVSMYIDMKLHLDDQQVFQPSK